MHEPRSATLEPLDVCEIAALRVLAQLDRSMAGLTRLAVRIQVLQAAADPAPGQAAGRGLSILEDCILFLLAALPALDAGEVGFKAMLFRCREDRRDDNAAALLCAGLEADCARLGLSPADVPEP